MMDELTRAFIEARRRKEDRRAMAEAIERGIQAASNDFQQGLKQVWGNAGQVTPSAGESAEDTEPKDGPVDGYRWRHNGGETAARLQAAAWRMVAHLWKQPERSATFDELKMPVYQDEEHVAAESAYGSLRKAVNNYFRKARIPYRVTIKKRLVMLVDK